MTRSRTLALFLTSATLLAAASAHAGEEDFGEDGQLIISGDRLFGLSMTKVKEEAGGAGSATVTDSETSVSLLWPNGPTPYQLPRASVDVVVGGGVTLGGSIGFGTRSGTTKTELGSNSAERDSPSVTLFALAPRVGYALTLTDGIAFWPRAGITYYSIKTEFTGSGATPSTSKTTTSGVGLDIEPMFVFSPASHFGITAGPILDFPLSGSQSTESSSSAGTPVPDSKVKYMNYGITVGVLGYF